MANRNLHGGNKTLSRLGIFLMFASLISFIVFYAIVMISHQGYKMIDPDTLELVQTEEIQEGSPTAIITTTMGEIRAVLYPEYAPQTVAQFISLAESGYYDNTYVFEVKMMFILLVGLGILPEICPILRRKSKSIYHRKFIRIYGLSRVRFVP